MKQLFLLALFTLLPFRLSQSVLAVDRDASSNPPQVIHVFVALCDNVNQGIVPVPAKIGNGQDPANNLYWGCPYGIKTYFRRSQDWKLVSETKSKGACLERVVFKHTSANYYLVADAYDGRHIRTCTIDFLQSCAGIKNDSLTVDGKVLPLYGHAQLAAYIGHDGLMDFSISQSFVSSGEKKRDCIILACVSKSYFAHHIRATGAHPLLWTTGLMCPEAYTLHDAIQGYVVNEPAENIRDRAARAYAKYQKCSVAAAKKLLVTGW